MKSTKHQAPSSRETSSTKLKGANAKIECSGGSQQHQVKAAEDSRTLPQSRDCHDLSSATALLRLHRWFVVQPLRCTLFMVLLGLWTSFAAQSPRASTEPTDYRNFEIIAKKNIFNPRRSPEYVPTERPMVRTRTETLALVGVMNYGKGPMAFFDGSRSDYRKVLKPSENIAGFKVTAIEPTSVKLASSTNEMELQLGMQLSREQEGEWKLAVRPESLDTSYYARATPLRSASQVNSERASDSQQENNPFGAIGNFFANGGFRGNGFPGGFNPGNQPQSTQSLQTQPSVTSSTTQPAAPADPNDILARMAARRAQENGDVSPDQRSELSPNQGAPPQPEQGGQPRPNQQPQASPDQNATPPPNQRGEPPNP